MHTRTRISRFQAVLLLAIISLVIPPLWGAGTGDGLARSQARRILAETGVRGGLIVHVGCGDGRLTAALRANNSYLVHGLDADAANVETARVHIQALGLYGMVSVEQYTGKRLPFTDNIVNLLVSEELGDISMAEVMRALCPNGVAYIKRNDKWTKTVKPRLEDIDEWTHALHDASNNAVANDMVVGPPRHIQWTGGPKWARSHDHLASTSVVVSSGGRIFYIVDEGSIAAVALPAKWFLVARDAFNGVVLWKRPVSSWEGHLRGFRSGPPELSRTLVAVGDRVYVTLGYGEPVSALDAATGRTLISYVGTDGPLEIVYRDDVLYVVAGDRMPKEADADAAAWRRGVTPRAHKKRIIAISAHTGKLLWKKSDTDTAEVMPTTLAVAGGRLFFQNTDAVLCLDANSGKELWRAHRPVNVKRLGWSTPTLVVYNGVVLSADRAVPTQAKTDDVPAEKVEWTPSSGGGNAPIGELIAFSAKTGERLWSCKCREGYNSPVDVLVADGLVWTGRLVTAREPGITEGRDPKTGEVKRERPADKTFFRVGMNHHRCYRNKATNRYLVLGRAGIELIDLKSGKGIANHWVRGVCQYGVIPCNGLLYAPPHSCACYPEALLNGFNALASERNEEQSQIAQARFQRGPAYSEVSDQKSVVSNVDDWPTYRHDSARSGCTNAPAPTDLKRAWLTELVGKLSSVAMAEGRVFVAQINAHTVHALDANDGERVWSYTAGGRVDSPPTIYQGLALFGSADGWVYCLRGSDGKLVWRFRAAPQESRIVAYGQVESVWPVHGSVLVQDDIAYCVAGRSSFLDGGLRLYRLNPKTGEVLSETRINSRDPKTGEEPQQTIRGTYMPGALPDVLSSDGASIYMRHVRFNQDGVVQASNVPHLFSSVGFLDDSWWHRSYWMFGTAMGTDYGGWPRAGNRVPAGRILVFDNTSVYGYGRNHYAHTGAHVGIDATTIFHYNLRRDAPTRWTNYQLFAARRDAAQLVKKGKRRRVESCIGIDKSASLNPANKPFSVVAWINTRKPNGVVAARGGSTHGYSLYIRGGKPNFAIRVNEKINAVAGKETVVGKWTHIVGVLTAEKELQVYVNGKLSGTADASGFIAIEPGEPMEIGADEGTNVGSYRSPCAFAGVIDEVRIYSRALTLAEVGQQYRSAGKADIDKALALYYSFDKGDATDESGKRNNGSVEGAKPADGKFGKAMRFSGKLRADVPPKEKYHWSQRARFVVRAMVLAGTTAASEGGQAGKTLFLAGAGQYATEEQAGKSGGRSGSSVLAALQAKVGAMLWAVSPKDGKKLAEYKLDSPVVWDGMAAAGGRLYMATVNGEVLCMGPRD